MVKGETPVKIQYVYFHNTGNGNIVINFILDNKSEIQVPCQIEDINFSYDELLNKEYEEIKHLINNNN